MSNFYILLHLKGGLNVAIRGFHHCVAVLFDFRTAFAVYIEVIMKNRIKSLFGFAFVLVIGFTNCTKSEFLIEISNSHIKREYAEIPNLDGFLTLKGDFHIHTVFSDGEATPEERVDEAILDGLDIIAITDHIEYWVWVDEKFGKLRRDLGLPERSFSLNLSYEIAQRYVNKISSDLIVIRGAEIAPDDMNPEIGHFNVLFLDDVDKLRYTNFWNPTEAQKIRYKYSYMDALRAAKAQGAFILFNHPGHATDNVSRENDVLWNSEHEMLFEQGFIQGVELYGWGYFPMAHHYAIEKNLTLFGNTDIHDKMEVYKQLWWMDGWIGKQQHRPMTLVFARERSVEAIREALFERRTLVYLHQYLIGEEKYLKEIFEKSVEITLIKTENEVEIILKNYSNLSFNIRIDIGNLNYYFQPRYLLQPRETQTITHKINNVMDVDSVNFIIDNLINTPTDVFPTVNKGITYTLEF